MYNCRKGGGGSAQFWGGGEDESAARRSSLRNHRSAGQRRPTDFAEEAARLKGPGAGGGVGAAAHICT